MDGLVPRYIKYYTRKVGPPQLHHDQTEEGEIEAVRTPLVGSIPKIPTSCIVIHCGRRLLVGGGLDTQRVKGIGRGILRT